MPKNPKENKQKTEEQSPFLKERKGHSDSPVILYSWFHGLYCIVTITSQN